MLGDEPRSDLSVFINIGSQILVNLFESILCHTRVNDCLYDEELPLDPNSFYTVVVNKAADRPRNAIQACVNTGAARRIRSACSEIRNTGINPSILVVAYSSTTTN